MIPLEDVKKNIDPKAPSFVREFFSAIPKEATILFQDDSRFLLEPFPKKLAERDLACLADQMAYEALLLVPFMGASGPILRRTLEFLAFSQRAPLEEDATGDFLRKSLIAMGEENLVRIQSEEEGIDLFQLDERLHRKVGTYVSMLEPAKAQGKATLAALERDWKTMFENIDTFLRSPIVLSVLRPETYWAALIAPGFHTISTAYGVEKRDPHLKDMN